MCPYPLPGHTELAEILRLPQQWLVHVLRRLKCCPDHLCIGSFCAGSNHPYPPQHCLRHMGQPLLEQQRKQDLQELAWVRLQAQHQMLGRVRQQADPRVDELLSLDSVG